MVACLFILTICSHTHPFRSSNASLPTRERHPINHVFRRSLVQGKCEDGAKDRKRYVRAVSFGHQRQPRTTVTITITPARG